MKRYEKGFTLIEVLVATAIMAMIGAGVTTTAGQIINGSQRNNDWATSVRHAQNIGYWVRQDALMAQSVNVTDDPETTDVEFIILDWKDWETGDTHNIRYILLDSADSLKKVQRKELTRDNNGVEIGNDTTFIADNINTANLSEQDGAWRLSVEAVSGMKNSAKTYRIGYRIEQY